MSIEKDLEAYDHNGDYALLAGSRQLIQSLLKDINLPALTKSQKACVIRRFDLEYPIRRDEVAFFG